MVSASEPDETPVGSVLVLNKGSRGANCFNVILEILFLKDVLYYSASRWKQFLEIIRLYASTLQSGPVLFIQTTSSADLSLPENLRLVNRHTVESYQASTHLHSAISGSLNAEQNLLLLSLLLIFAVLRRLEELKDRLADDGTACRAHKIRLDLGHPDPFDFLLHPSAQIRHRLLNVLQRVGSKLCAATKRLVARRVPVLAHRPCC
ncbi:MAG: hypothetical protein BYD32DRAFT_478482 [Podila humilis]|nr:MAG: hypothetical protein BYD32DRAFT_478482 [Podila humilis]